MGTALKQLYARLAIRFALTPLFLAALLFIPAWTLRYWEAWVFIAVSMACSLPVTVWVAARDPRLLERRMSVGPSAERRATQKVAIATVFVAFAAAPVLSALDHRLGWSDMPTPVALLGNALVALSYLGFFLVYKENTYGAATVRVEENQKVITTGPYAVIRHPMYATGLLLLLATPLALGSWWGLVAFVPGVLGHIGRILDEEDLLRKDLPGYVEYSQMVRYRLIPCVW